MFSFISTYTARNQLDQLTQSGNGYVYANYGYDKNGNVTSRTTLNGVTSTYGYDAANHLTDITNPFTTGTETMQYHYNAVGNRIDVERSGGKADGFTYDSNSQLVSFRRDGTYAGTVTGGTYSGFVLDASGNRTSVTTAGTTTPYSPNNLNQYGSIGGQTQGYDFKGNLASYDDGGGTGTWTYTYDAMNRLTLASKPGITANFYYDGLNRQVARSITGQTTAYSVWDGWQLFAEYSPAGWLRSLVYGAPGDLLEKVESGVANTMFYPDGNGNVTHAVSGGGALVEKYTYDVYGRPSFFDAGGTALAGSAYNVDHLFNGQQYYATLGLYDLRNRYYSPSLGRFLQPDPIGFGGDPSNIYRYCGNNPVNRSDPYGLGPLDLLKDLWRTISGTVPGTATTERIIVNGQEIPDSSAESAGPYPVGPATPLDYAPNNGGMNSGGGGGGNGSSADGKDNKRAPRNPTPENPCLEAAGAPRPSVYATAGQAAYANPITSVENLFSFRRGAALDAQQYGATPAYANYAFGVYMAAADFTLRQTLAAADTYAQFFSTYRTDIPTDRPLHPFTPQANVTNITNGFNAQTAGTPCQ